MEAVIDNHIEITPGVCGGKPRIAGHRIRVMDIVLWTESWGWAPDEIVANYPQLSLGDVHAALAYYFDHQAEIRRHIEESERFVEEMRKLHPSKLQAKLEAMRGSKDSVLPGRKRKPSGGKRVAAPRS